VFVERSIYTDYHCFAKLCYQSGKMTKLEYDIYCKWNDWLSTQFNVMPDVYIYLRCEPNINDIRVKERARSSEEHIPIEYLEALHEKHDEWLNFEKEKGVPVYVIDATQNFKDPLVMDKIFEELFVFLKTFLRS
jgi:deoxyadenosine/deoxycytidine kinase